MMEEKHLLHKMAVWNKRVDEGDEVEHRPHPASPKRIYRVAGPARIVAGQVVVALTGKAGVVSIRSCKKVV